MTFLTAVASSIEKLGQVAHEVLMTLSENGVKNIAKIAQQGIIIEILPVYSYLVGPDDPVVLRLWIIDRRQYDLLILVFDGCRAGNSWPQ